MRNLVISVVVIGCLFFAGGLWFGTQFLYSTPGSSEEAVVFEVPQGATFISVANRLEAQGLIKNALFLRIFAKVTGQESKVKRGEYALNKGMYPSQILSELVSGKSITYPLTIPEGWNIYEIAVLVESKQLATREEFLRLVKDPSFVQSLLGERWPSLEGYLFPETYMYTKFTTLKDLVQAMVARFKVVYAELQPEMKGTTMTQHQIVTLASVIEKETGAPEERPMISSIFHNRLNKRMRLQSDPTILYGMLAATGIMPSNITRADILRPSDYNTYTVAALPVGPIGNPGRLALLAAVRPATSEFFYFVSKNDGTHIFTKTYEDHSSQVRKFQMDPKAREGKSWRDLKTKGASKAPLKTNKK